MTIFINKTKTSELFNFMNQHPGAFYVGRGFGSCLGNPFRASSNDSQSIATVVAGFRMYLNMVVQGWEPLQAASYCEMEYGLTVSSVWQESAPSRERVMQQLRLISGAYRIQESVNLVCFCVNRPWKKKDVYTECHAEVVAACVAQLMEEK